MFSRCLMLTSAKTKTYLYRTAPRQFSYSSDERKLLYVNSIQMYSGSSPRSWSWNDTSVSSVYRGVLSELVFHNITVMS